MLLLNKHNLAVADFASKEDSRYTLKAIHVTPTETVATDGHILAVVTTPTVEAKNFPVIAGFTPNGHTPFLLEIDNCAKIAKALPRKTTIPVLNHCAVSVDSETGNAQIAVTDLDTSQVFQQRKVSGQFPDWKAVMPTKEPALKIGFNASLLLKMAKAVEKFTDNGTAMHHVTLEFTDNQSCMKFTAKNQETGQTLTGVLMPARI